MQLWVFLGKEQHVFSSVSSVLFRSFSQALMYDGGSGDSASIRSSYSLDSTFSGVSVWVKNSSSAVRGVENVWAPPKESINAVNWWCKNHAMGSVWERELRDGIDPLTRIWPSLVFDSFFHVRNCDLPLEGGKEGLWNSGVIGPGLFEIPAVVILLSHVARIWENQKGRSFGFGLSFFCTQGRWSPGISEVLFSILTHCLVSLWWKQSSIRVRAAAL